MNKLFGVNASEGIAVGRLFFLPEENELSVTAYNLSDEDIAIHEKRLQEAFDEAKQQLQFSIDKIDGNTDSTEKAILQTHLSMISDNNFVQEVIAEMKESKTNVEYILKKKVDEVVNMLNSQPDDYLRARVIDIQDSYRRVLSFLLGNSSDNASRFSNIPQGSILIAKEIRPSEAGFIREARVAGIITKEGTKASHISIMARAWNIPMLVGVSDCLNIKLSENSVGIIDAHSGTAFFNPSEQTVDEYTMLQKKELELYKSALMKQEKYQNQQVKTADGIPVNIYANIAIPDEMTSPFFKCADGVGLFRTEFLCLENGKLPDEESQFRVYSDAVKLMKEKPLVIRTFDVGADKAINEQKEIAEKNPMLGWRGIRYFLENKHLLKTQLKAIVRAAVFGKVRILIPMVSEVDEIIQVRAYLNEAVEECKADGNNCKADVPLGIMIEVPAVAIIADVLAEYVDFMSIGTNDLIQYIMATDRENHKVSKLASYFQPAVIRLLATVIQSAEKIQGNLPVSEKLSMCGEMASDKRAIVLLIAMGLRNFSMSARNISKIKEFISKLNYSDTVEIFNAIKNETGPTQIKKIISKKQPELK